MAVSAKTLAETGFDQNLFINSDHLTLNQNNSSATFKSNVVVRFKDMVLKTSILIVYYNELDGKRSIDRIYIPTKLKAIKTCNDEVVIANKGEYFAPQNKLVLTGNVRLKRKDNVLITNKLVYYTKIIMKKTQ